jgi:hypothetical protein
VQVTTTRPRARNHGRRGVVSHAGSRLLADVADRTTLTGQLVEALAGLQKPRSRHDPGRVLVDMAVAVADGARTISDVAVLTDQAELFGSVARTRRAGGCWSASGPLLSVMSRRLGRPLARCCGRSVPRSPASRSRRLEQLDASCPVW